MKIILCFSLLVSICTSTHGFDIKCVGSYPEIHPDYPKLVCRADRLLSEGEFKAAEKVYLEAARLDFFESPNFEIYMRISRAQCLDGRTAECKVTLVSFEQMLNIYTGKETCMNFQNELSTDKMKTIRVMCGEIRESTYGDQTQEVIIFEKSYRKQISQLRRYMANTKINKINRVRVRFPHD